MARKEIEIVIADDNRDKGKVFRITEMPATKAQEFADRVFFAAMNCGVKVPGEIGQIGMAEMYAAGIAMAEKIPYEWAKPLLEMLMECVDLRTEAGTYRKRVESDIEEITTAFKLRTEALKLHFSFFGNGGGSISGQAQASETTASSK